MSSVLRRRFSQKTWLAIVVAALATAACGGSSPLAPSAVAPISVPGPTADSRFPSLLGTWAGTLTINATVLGTSSSNRCDTTWIITSQTDGVFSGTFQTSGGGTTSCGQSGTVGGGITASGGLTALSFGVQVGAISGCTRQTGTPYAGLLTGSTLSATSSERLTCTIGGTTSTADRNAVFSVTRR